MIAALLMLGLVPFAMGSFDFGDDEEPGDDFQSAEPAPAVQDGWLTESEAEEEPEDPAKDPAEEPATETEVSEAEDAHEAADPTWLSPEIGVFAISDFDPEIDRLMLDFTNTDVPDSIELTETEDGDPATALHLGFGDDTMTVAFSDLGTVPLDAIFMNFETGDGSDAVPLSAMIEDSVGIDPIDPEAEDVDYGGGGDSATAIGPADPDAPDEEGGSTPVEGTDPGDPVAEDEGAEQNEGGLDPVDPDGEDDVTPIDAGEGTGPVDPDEEEAAGPEDVGEGTDPVDPDADDEIHTVELNGDGLTDPAVVEGFQPQYQTLQIDIENPQDGGYSLSVRPDSWGEDGLVLLDENVAVRVVGVSTLTAEHIEIVYS